MIMNIKEIEKRSESNRTCGITLTLLSVAFLICYGVIGWDMFLSLGLICGILSIQGHNNLRYNDTKRFILEVNKKRKRK